MLGQADRVTGVNARPIKARWVIQANALLCSPAHFSGDTGNSVDMLLLRDVDGYPLLPGTTLAGALRNHLNDYLCGYFNKGGNTWETALLFGGECGEQQGSQSPLIIFDSRGLVPGETDTEIRDGVTIDPATGTAEKHKKFDWEILPAGTKFKLRFELVIGDEREEGNLLGLLQTALSSLDTGELSIGARRSRGFGRMAAQSWRAYRYSLSCARSWCTWLLTDIENPFPSDLEPFEDVHSALQQAWLGHSILVFKDLRERMKVQLDLCLAGGILVRSVNADPLCADSVHLHSGGRPVLPGTSLAGVLRGRAMRIARLVRKEQRDAELWVESIFGPRLEGTTGKDFTPKASKIRISEAAIGEGTTCRPSRIEIDRFTQGVSPGALFEEEPYHGGKCRVTLELRNPGEGEAGLLFLVLKDLLSGNLPIGGSSSVGRGVVTGTGTVYAGNGRTIKLSVTEPLEEGDLRYLNDEITAFHQAVKGKGGEHGQ